MRTHAEWFGIAGRRQETPGLVGQVFEDGTGLEQAQRLDQALRRMVDNRRNPPIGADALERCLLLLAFTDIDRQQAVLKLQLFKQDADLQAIASRPVIQIDHA